jgi:hypothetical protein
MKMFGLFGKYFYCGLCILILKEESLVSSGGGDEVSHLLF